jgi:AdoMet-dependent rRNA methyltransferase SPB1
LLISDLPPFSSQLSFVSVLHDGAPNVGTAWLQDAYGQAELTLSSLRLAAEFLRPGGIFVTKVFRSKDYNALLWVFNQLFGSVEATKPQASRNQSAEIFVVCRHFTAAKYIDPKLLDPRHVFKDLDAPSKPTDIFHQGKQRRHREGYADDAGPLLFRKLSVARFVEDENPIGLLGEYNQLSFDKDSEFYANHKATDSEVKHCCEDLKVLNKRDFKALLKWRLSLRGTDYCKEKIKILREAAKAARRAEGEEEGSDSEVEVEEVDMRPLTEAEEESLVDEEIDTKVKELDKRARKAKKLEKKRRKKLIQRANLKMNVDASDILQATPGEQELFELDDESRVVGAEVADPEDPGNLEDETVFLGGTEYVFFFSPLTSLLLLFPFHFSCPSSLACFFYSLIMNDSHTLS